MIEQQTYSFLDCQCSISGPGGSFSLGSGAGAAEEGITTDMVDRKNTMTIGADGSGMHSLHASNAGTFIVRLLKTSPTNRLLNQLYNTQRQSSTTWGQNTVQIYDTARGDQVTLRGAAFAKQPALVFAKVGNVNEWEFEAIQRDDLLGSGSPSLS
jgi:hypothetical protein